MLYGAGDLRFEERPLESQSLAPDEVYVETEVSAMSTGTDLANYLGDSTFVPGAPTYPRTVGHSNAGSIRRAGASVRKLKVGQRVFSLKPHQSAYIAREDELVVPIPDGVSSEVASLAYLTHLGLASLRQARYEAGEHVVVIGIGVIGLCTVWLARAMGAKVAAIAKAPPQVKAALRLGAHAAFLAGELGLKEKLGQLFGDAGADIVVLTANSWDAYRTALEVARRGGRVSILGFPGRGQQQPDFSPLDPRWIYDKQLTLLGAGHAPRTDCPPEDLRFNMRRNLNTILGLMASQRPGLDSAITHRFPASRMQEAYELAKNHDKSLAAAVFDWRLTR